jgi:hypothetical protein
LARIVLIWTALAAAIGAPLALAATSPLLQWRGPIYIAACYAGILALALMLAQPLLIGGHLPGFSAYRARRLHRGIGGALVAAIIVHVAGLWFTSPPDMVDALLLASPTPFSPYGVAAMWALFAVALLAMFRRHIGLRAFRIAHLSLAVVILAGSAAHAWLVEGIMETISKAALCVLTVAAGAAVMARRVWGRRAGGGGEVS